MKVYLVVFEWSTEDDSDVDIEAFDSYEKAAERFNERIQEEKTDMSWDMKHLTKAIIFLPDMILTNVRPTIAWKRMRIGLLRNALIG